MAKQKYLTISEFAKLKGVSNQAVYKQLTTKLSKYVVVVDNKKMLKIECVEDFGLNQVDNNQVKVDNQNINQVDNQNELVQFLKQQIIEKDKQIEKLQESAEQKDKYIQEQGTKLADLIEQANILQQNNQILLKQLTGTVEDDKDVVIVTEQEDNTPEIKEDKQEVKKGLFSKLFG